jgi:hypothetical protein
VPPCLTCRVGSGFWALGQVESARASLFDVSGWVGFWGFGSGRPVPPCLACWSDRPVPICLTCRGRGFSGWVGSARASLFDVSGWVFSRLGRVFGLWVGSGRPVPPCLTCRVGSARASLFDVSGRGFSSWVGSCLPV